MGWMGPWWLFLLILVIGVWYFTTSGKGSRDASTPSPEEILKQRYAKGELDRETYERMLSDLRK